MKTGRKYYMNWNKFFKKVNLSIAVVMIIGILAALNFFSYNIFYRFDLTQNKDYSLSKASKDMAVGLKDVVNIKAYFSSNLPTQFLNLRQEVGDILEEYANYSGGNIRVEFIDPKDDQEIKQELSSVGIPELQFNALEKDKYQVVNGYLGMLIKYGEKSQAIPVIQDTKDLEYQITSSIKKLTSGKIANIGFWQGNGAADTEQGAGAAYEKLGEIYNVSEFNFKEGEKISDSVDILIIIAPSEKFQDNELKAMSEFLSGGGSLVVLADGVKVGQGLSASKNDTGLNKIFQNYGVKLNEDLALDANNGMASFNQGFVSFTVNYPYWPKVIKSGFDQNNPAVSRLESLVLPWASTIDVDPDKTNGASVSYLAATSNNAAAVSDNFKLSPQDEIIGGKAGKFNLAVSLTGKSGNLVLVGDGDFIRDGFLRNYPDNLLFFQNVIDGLSLGEDLISIRSKGVTERPIKEISESAKAAIRYSNIFGLTIAVILFGLARYYFRKRMETIL